MLLPFRAVGLAPDLTAGELQVATVSADGTTTWREVPDPSAAATPTRDQVPGATRFRGGEGTFYDDGQIYFTTKSDNRVWQYDTNTTVMKVLYDDNMFDDAPLTGVDNAWVSKGSGDLFIAEDGGDLDIVMITPEGVVARLLKLTGDAHAASEIAGPAMDPSGRRLYFSSQRGDVFGVTFEVTGPFRNTRTKTEVKGTSIERPAPPPAATKRPAADDLVELPSTGGSSVSTGAGLAGGAALLRRILRGNPDPS